MNKIIGTRFGDIEYEPDKTLHFPEGLIGFGHLRDFVVMPQRKPGPLFWMQSVEDPALAFILTDPQGFFLDYAVTPDAVELRKLGIDEQDECLVLAVATVPPDRKITLNLAAPILFSPKNNRAVQVILEKTSWQTRTPLPAA
ncbi:flagellar assembly factor FliW [Geoalkalibacter ferrihydriticus]|uniref:Flagellar assembly factor FliW n=2 Tax=Geoalkalibacter ferrihydriticus TaxID=392333 RepID=A0A0C2HXP8_9BACT|nr:flagellar assembly protein FliW [Geoalkalibacter ferrihydriticus]KIH77542.1 flagellar assembly protein FliW [Geoalkalibacter ferrihydriticus DSM 17813]SDL67117.1 flagellar assembly factor FliW [Geoalkalibacter ferrihydriticus]